MSKRFFKPFAVLSILAMLVAAVGVTPARAADSGSWYDSFAALADASVPYFNAAVDMTTANGSLNGDLGGCVVAPSFGTRQLHLWEGQIAGVATYSYARVRVVSDDNFDASWAVRVSLNEPGLTELGCAANNTAGVVDFTVAVPWGWGFIVTIASNGAFVPLDTTYETWVYTTSNPASFIIDMRADAGTQAGRAVQASPVAGGLVTYWNEGPIGANMQAYLDVPVGAYNLGIQDTTGAPLAVYIANRSAIGYYAINPTALATETVTVRTEDETGAAVNLDIIANTNASLIEDLFVGTSAGGVYQFKVNPGAFGWDVGAWADFTTRQFYMVERNVNPLLGDVDFRLDTVAHQVILLCYYDTGSHEYDDVDVLGVNPEGNLNPHDFDIENDGDAYCTGAPLDGGRLYLSGGISYSGMTVRLLGDNNDWLTFLEPTVKIWNFAGVAGVRTTFDYSPIFGQPPWKTVSTASAVFVDTPGVVTVAAGPWTDQFGNKIVEVRDDDDLTYNKVYPIYTVWYGVDSIPSVLSNNSYEAFSSTDGFLGRWMFTACFAHDYLPDNTHPGDFCAPDKQFAITPADVHYGTDWAFHFIMTMYEKGLTGGTSATLYSPYLNTDRGQMAAFLANGFVSLAGQTLPAYAAAFTDVSSTDWFARSVQYLKNLGITGGTGGGLYSPYAPVIRGDMAIFLEKTGQSISVVAPAYPLLWDPALGTDLFYPLGLTGAWYLNDPGIYNGWFTDVPASAYYATMAEEALADGLTGGCFAGTPYLSLQFCPTMIVDRSQMAVFMGRTWSLAEAPAWWDITAVPAPEE